MRLGLFVVITICAGAAVGQTVSTKSFTIEINEECRGTENAKALKFLEVARDRKNDKDERMEALEKCLAQDPDCAEAYYYRGLELFRSAKSSGASYGPAEKSLLECVRLCPDFHFEPYYFLAYINFGRSDYAATVRYFERYLKLSAASTEALDDARETEIAEDYAFAKFFADAFASPVPFSPTKVNGVSTEFDEYLPLISPDNERMLLTRQYVTKSQVRASYAGSNSPVISERFVQAKRLENEFDEGEPLPPPFNENEAFHYGGACLSLNNKELFVTICEPMANGYNNCDIFQSKLQLGVDKETGLEGYRWSALENLGANVNGAESWESQPTLSADGNTLIFATARADSKGIDLFNTTRGADGKWSKAVPLSPLINTENNEKTPFLHSDSRTLYFASDGHLGFGAYDVFLSRQGEDGAWGKPVNLGHPINTEADEQAFVISTDGKKVYYSAKPDGSATGIDIWSFDLYKEARPEQVLFVKGTLKDSEGEPARNATIELKTMESKSIARVKVDEDDGGYAAVVVVKNNEDAVLNVKADGMAFQSKLIESTATDVKHNRMGDEQAAANTVQNINLAVEEVKEGGVYRINDIYYSTNSSEISNKSTAVLDEFAAYLKENSSMRIAIHGHTDDVGKAEDNLALSTDRAFSVKQYLESRGVAGARIEYRGFGESVPFATNETDAGRALNRRTEFLILNK